MKQRIVVFLCALSVMALIGCGGNSLDGTWTATRDGDTNSLIFAGGHCFFIDEYNDVRKYNFTFDNNAGTIQMGWTNASFTLRGNTLTVSSGGINIPFLKDTKTTTPSAIAGVWAVRDTKWLLAFMGNTVFLVDNDGDETHAVYTFTNNSGSFLTERYGYNVTFNVSGNTLSANVTSNYYDGPLSFTRQ